MPEINPLGPGSFEKFSGLSPVLSFREVHEVTDGVERYLQHLIDSYKRHLAQPLMDAGNAGARLEVKALSPLAEHLTPPETLLTDLVSNVQNDLAGRIAPAIALLESLGHPYGALPDMGKGLGQLPSPPPGAPRLAGPSGSFVGSGDASRGRSAGALTAKENELGVDPVVVDSSSVDLTGPSAGVNFTPPPPGTVSAGVNAGAAAPQPAMSPRAQAYLTQCQQQNPGCCDPPWVVWAPPVAGASPCVVSSANCPIPGGWTPCGNQLANLDDALALADQCTAAGTCPGGPPTVGGPTPPPPTQPPPPIGQPPPPPPECCPPPVINIPPCPPPPSLPECVKVEFCDWQKLCDTLKDCLPGAKPEEDCALDNESAWAFKDCDGTFTSALGQYLGSLSGGIPQATSLDDVQAQVLTNVLSIPSDVPATLGPPSPSPV